MRSYLKEWEWNVCNYLGHLGQCDTNRIHSYLCHVTQGS